MGMLGFPKSFMKVSILVPCYNVEAFLPQCLGSIVNQTYRDLQIVIVDDGSRDRTLSVAQEYAAKDSRIEVYHQDNLGVAAARNALLSKIRGDFFLFIDSDDWIEPDMVEFLLTNAEKENADMVTCGMVVNDTPVCKKYSRDIYDNNKVVERFLYHIEFRGSLWNKLISVSLLNNEPKFHCGISYGEDALFCWELLKVTDRVVYTDRQFYHYRMNSDSISHKVFGPKKLSAHDVWTSICEDTEVLYPQYLNIAQARFCIEATLLLRNAAHCHYAEKENIRMLQRTIRKYRHRLNEVVITNQKLKWYAAIASKNYWLAGFL